jgi:hypothetical protein
MVYLRRQQSQEIWNEDEPFERPEILNEQKYYKFHRHEIMTNVPVNGLTRPRCKVVSLTRGGKERKRNEQKGNCVRDQSVT